MLHKKINRSTGYMYFNELFLFLMGYIVSDSVNIYIILIFIIFKEFFSGHFISYAVDNVLCETGEPVITEQAQTSCRCGLLFVS